MSRIYDDDGTLHDLLEDRPLDLEQDGSQKITVHIRRRLVGRRLDKYLHGRFPRVSRTLIQRLIKQGGITVNGRPTKASYEPDGGDSIEMLVPPPEPYEVVPEEMPLDIV